MGLTLQHSTSGGLRVAHGLHHRGGAKGQEGGQAGHTRPPAATSLPSSLNRNVLPPDTAAGITSLQGVHLSFQGGLVALSLTSRFTAGEGFHLCDKSLDPSNLLVS